MNSSTPMLAVKTLLCQILSRADSKRDSKLKNGYVICQAMQKANFAHLPFLAMEIFHSSDQKVHG